MRKIFLILILGFLCSLPLFSQTTNTAEIDSMLNQAFDLRWENPYESILICSRALELSKKINYPSGIIKSYSFMGVAYENLSMYEESLKNYLEGLRIADSLNSKEDIGFAYNNLSNYYIQLGNFEIAYDYLQRGLEIALEINNPNLLAYIYRNLSSFHRKKNEFQKALEYAQKSLELREKISDLRGIITSLREELVIYYNLNDFDNAEKILNRLYKLIGNDHKFSLQLARIKRTEGELLVKKKEFNKALKAFNESIEIFKSINNLDGMIRVLKLKSDLYKSLGNYREAFNALSEHNKYDDSLNNIRSLQRISLIESQFKNKELQNELLLAAEELQQRNIILISLFVGFVILGFSALLTHRANREKRRLIQKITEQNKVLEQDNIHKQKLLSVIGHDVKNPLSSVYSISEYLVNNTDDIDKNELNNFLIIINKSVKNALSLLDNLLLWSMSKLGKLNYKFSNVQIKSLVNKAVELYNSSINEKNLKIVVNVDNQIVHADENTLSAIIRNLLNNAIKFSYNDGTIKIEAEELDGHVKVKVIDNGKGLTEAEINKILSNDEQTALVTSKAQSSTGLGLQLVKDFLKINQGKLYIKSIPNKETEFSFIIPKAK